MQLSRFVVRYQDVRPGEHILYSVLLDRYLGIDDATQESLDRWTAGGWPANQDERALALTLIEEGFVVQEREEDDAALRAHLETAREGLAGTMMITLLPTLQCNLACDYCFQKDSPSFTKMDQSTELSTLLWILRTVDERKLHTLKVHYFGGEPTTRKDFCLRTAEVLQAAMAARCGRFEWIMTTNGVLLDLPFVRAMTGFGQGAIKVTLDGDKDTHDRTRKFRDGRGSFDQIFENIVACAPYVKISVGGNFFPGQAASYERLLARLESSGLSGKLASVRFKPVVDVDRGATQSCRSCDHGEGDGGDEVRTLVQLNAAVTRRRLGPVQGEVLESMLGPCELHWKNNYTIDPEGNVYKCPAVAGRAEMAVSSVRGLSSADREAAREKPAPLLELRPWEKCGDCPYLPVCLGGCLGGQWLKNGRIDEVSCKRESFTAAFRESVVRRYLAEFTAPEDGWQSATA
jgi:uncharacterized protein